MFYLHLGVVDPDRAPIRLWPMIVLEELLGDVPAEVFLGNAFVSTFDQVLHVLAP